jgi:hypothetical protein
MENLHKQNVGLDSSSKFDSYKTPRITQDYNNSSYKTHKANLTY